MNIPYDPWMEMMDSTASGVQINIIKPDHCRQYLPPEFDEQTACHYIAIYLTKLNRLFDQEDQLFFHEV